jgi:hypothetical protein
MSQTRKEWEVMANYRETEVCNNCAYLLSYSRCQKLIELKVKRHEEFIETNGKCDLYQPTLAFENREKNAD